MKFIVDKIPECPYCIIFDHCCGDCLLQSYEEFIGENYNKIQELENNHKTDDYVSNWNELEDGDFIEIKYYRYHYGVLVKNMVHYEDGTCGTLSSVIEDNVIKRALRWKIQPKSVSFFSLNNFDSLCNYEHVDSDIIFTYIKE